MFIKMNNQVVTSLQPRYVGEEIIVSIDASKTNTGITVRNKYGVILDVYDFNGENDGTTELDTLVLCQKQRDALRVLLKNSKPVIVGIEDVITKKQKGETTGIDIHQSRVKITCVFMSFICFFQEVFNITPEPVNNWAWKAAVLPPEFRTREYKKGSLAYFKAINSKYQYYSDDVTDSICIGDYLVLTHNIKDLGREILKAEIKEHDFKYFLTSKEQLSKYKKENLEKFVYNAELTLEQNVTVMANQMQKDKISYAEVDVKGISLAEIYSKCAGTFSKRTDTLIVLVVRK